MLKIAKLLFVALLLWVALVSRPPTLAAQGCAAEAEPNDEPAQASTLAGCVRGRLESQDQDLFWLEVPDAERRYTFSVEGMAEGLTRLQLLLPQLNDEGQVTAVREYGDLKLFHGAPGSTPAMQFAAGRYLLGLSGAGGVGAYRLAVTSEALTGVAESEPNDEQEAATLVQPGQPVLAAFDSEGRDHFRWTVDEPEALWQITVQGPVGLNYGPELYDSDGQRLAYGSPDVWGRVIFYDFRFAAGEARLMVPRQQSAAPYSVLIERRGTVAPDREFEPNSEPPRANFWPGPTLQGRGTPGDGDDFAFFVAGNTDRYTELTLTTNHRGRHELCLYETEGHRRLQCRSGVGEITLPDLVLSEGVTYTTHLDLASPEADAGYTLTRVAGERVNPAREMEPNDEYQQATPLPRDGRIAGRLAGDEWDIFRLTVRDRVQLWRVQVLGEGIHDFRLLASNGAVQQSAAIGEQRSRLSNLVLPIGDHYFALRGSGDYRLMALPLGEGPAGFEVEPNDAAGQPNPLHIAAPRSGFLHDPADWDRFSFSLDSARSVRLTLTPPPDGDFLMILWWEEGELMRVVAEEPGETLLLENTLAAGEYQVVVRVDSAASGDLYALELEEWEGTEPLVDIEPFNDDPERAPLVPESLVLQGSARQSDRDHYRLPPLPLASHLAIRTDGPVELVLWDEAGERVALEEEEGRWRTTSPLLADARYTLRVGQAADYALTLDFARGIEAVPPPAPLDAELSLSFDEAELAAWWTSGQQLTGTLTIRSERAATVRLEAHSPHPSLMLTLPPTVALRAGRTTTLPVPLAALADLPAGRYPLEIRVGDERQQAQVEAEIVASAEALPRHPTQLWPLPDLLLGSFDAAATAFGAQPVENPEALLARQAYLHDGSTALAGYFAATTPVTLTVDLAGDAPLPVVGFALHPQSRERPQSWPRRIELLLSVDGRRFRSVYSGALSAQPREQIIVLPAPITASHARLIVHDVQGNQSGLTMGEWKVLTREVLSPTLNLLDPQLGGYVVEAQPQWYSSDMLGLLLPDGSATTLRAQAGEEARVTVGFHHNRAALIEQVAWLPAADSTAPAEPITVSLSLDSLLGPWQVVGSFTSSDGGLSFDEPQWARFVRFTFPSADERVYHALPQQILIRERASDDDYRSILAEWGHYQRRAVYEWLNPPPLPTLAGADDDNDSLERADPLRPGTPVVGDVQVLEDSDWYAVEVPANANAVRFTLGGTPTVETRLVVVDAAGTPLPVQGESAAGAAQTLIVSAPPGSTLYARVEEPPRSIMFVWDNSGSVSPYYEHIYRAVNAFTQEVVAGREAVNYIVLEMESPLLEAWSDDPIVLQRELTNYPRIHDDSEAEFALFVASNAMAFRDGVKAIVLIADAEATNARTAELWRALEAVQPRIFTMHVHSTHAPGNQPADFQDRMQSWADANGGFYDWFRTAPELENGFARAATWLRRPKPYTLVAEPLFVEPPGPGTLRVRSSAAGDDEQAAARLLGNTAVELIVDASGSMQQALGGQARIEIAKSVLDTLVATILPDEVPVALRVFGNREGEFSCRTDLELPLAPLSRDALRATIAEIQPQNRAATPIGASLALVAEDLAGATGPRLVILLTDGEETCNGDPRAAIQQLRASGVDVRINIVGFAIDNESLKATFEEWAALGGGQYFDATDGDELSGFIAQALRVPFRVLDADGALVGEGVVDGAPLELAAGRYTVELLSAPVQRYEVTVIGEQESVVGVNPGPASDN